MVGSETLSFHHHCNITQHVSEALLVQAAQHMGGMHCRLKCKHRQLGGRHGHQRHLYVGLYTHTHTYGQLLPIYNTFLKKLDIKIDRKHAYLTKLTLYCISKFLSVLKKVPAAGYTWLFRDGMLTNHSSFSGKPYLNSATN